MLLKRLMRRDTTVSAPSAELQPLDTRVLQAVVSGQFADVRDCLRDGANVNFVDEAGDSLLHIAAKAGNEKIVWLLLDRGAFVNGEGQNGFTPLHVAAEFGHPGVCEILLENGADANATEEDGLTPLHVAAANGFPEVCDVLLEHGANPESKDQAGRMSVDLAADQRHMCVLQKLETASLGQERRMGNVPDLTRLSSAISTTDSVSSAGSFDRWTLLAAGGARPFRGVISGVWRGTPRPITEAEGDEAPRTPDAPRLADMTPGIRSDAFRTDSGQALSDSSTSTRSNSSYASSHVDRPTPKKAVADSLWNSSDILEANLMQQVKEGTVFGDDDRFVVKKAHHAQTASAALVYDTFEGSECFAKFFVAREDFEIEKGFYLFWRSLGMGMARRGRDLWPLVKAICPEGSTQGISASALVLEKGDCTLDDRAKSATKMDADTPEGVSSLLMILSEICCGIKVMHDWGWVHRDLKPANVMYFTGRDRWKLVDFGISARIGSEVPVQYTLRYAPPEVVKAQFDGQESMTAMPSVDMWSLALVALAMFSNKTPFCDIPLREWMTMLLGMAEFPFESDPTWFETVPEAIREIVKGTLIRDPAQRLGIDDILAKLPTHDPITADVVAGAHINDVLEGGAVPKEALMARAAAAAARPSIPEGARSSFDDAGSPHCGMPRLSIGTPTTATNSPRPSISTESAPGEPSRRSFSSQSFSARRSLDSEGTRGSSDASRLLNVQPVVASGMLKDPTAARPARRAVDKQYIPPICGGAPQKNRQSSVAAASWMQATAMFSSHRT